MTQTDHKNDSDLYDEIRANILSDVSHLPALPEITLRVRNKLSHPDCTVHAAAELLRTDPGLSAFIMRISNSARYYFRQPPRDLESAVLRIGLMPTAILATTYATRALLTTTSARLKPIIMRSYQHSTDVAVLSSLLATQIRGIDADKTLLAGLLQDISLQPVLNAIIDRPELFDDIAQRNAIIDTLSPQLNTMTLEHWGFDQETIDAVGSRKQWSRDESDKIDMGDIILIGQYYALMDELHSTDCPPMEQIPAFKKLPDELLQEDNTLMLLQDSQQELEILQQSLSLAA